MLLNLHIKNLILIEEEEISFLPGLNILSGETGAGKSIILGALSLALGGRASRDVIRDDSHDALVEATFSASDEVKELLASYDIETLDEVVLTRKISGDKSVARINGETVPAGRLREVGALLIDIYGQHEHQSLLHRSKHLALLDSFMGDDAHRLLDEVAAAYKEYADAKRELEEADVDESERLRELSFLEHEVAEITDARLSPGEDEAVEEEYKKLSAAEKISQALSGAYGEISGGSADGISRALREVSEVAEYDPALSDIASALTDAESIISDAARSLSSYISDMESDAGRFAEVESRLDTINLLKSKYGRTIEDILAAAEEKSQRIKKLQDHDEYIAKLRDEVMQYESHLKDLSTQLSDMRKNAASKLCSEVTEVLSQLQFLDADFRMEFSRRDSYSARGFDEAEFMMSANPGEPVRPLSAIASGGELSRVMLAIKTILAKKDTIDTLIFDEIDAGISGRTAQAVSEKIYLVARERQVICITHLPQIAAMADHHYLIEKEAVDGGTISSIRGLYGDQITAELSRLIGGAEITEVTMESAAELRSQAAGFKSRC
ncbi:MAG: DNA repair protein RecN [Lachnospiraceae bacterium]|nr:DNA repair protein RecN [Lachnospiraceae bacterium]